MHPFIIVTGASRGIGRAICSALLEANYFVLGIARHFEQGDLNHPRFEKKELDLSDLSALPKALKELRDTYPHASALICNAGQGQFKHLEEFSFGQIQDLINLNFLSHVYLTKTFLPTLKKQTKSHIIFIGSEAALIGKREGTLYCASKFALRGFAQALRDECATTPLRISLINPGMVQTSFFDNLSFRPGPEPSEHLLPEDVAEVVLTILEARVGAIWDEVNLSPHKKKICFLKRSDRPH